MTDPNPNIIYFRGRGVDIKRGVFIEDGNLTDDYQYAVHKRFINHKKIYWFIRGDKKRKIYNKVTVRKNKFLIEKDCHYTVFLLNLRDEVWVEIGKDKLQEKINAKL